MLLELTLNKQKPPYKSSKDESPQKNFKLLAGTLSI
jgi:hypothetical protein